MKDLIIVGVGGMGREVAWLVERINIVNKTWNLLGFIDDNPEVQNLMINRYPVLGTTEDVIKYPETAFVCAIGASSIRKKVIEKMESVNSKIHYATLIDPSVIISNLNVISEGTIICAGSIVTVNIVLGKHVLINTNCTIGHDAVLKDFVTLYPNVNVSGNTIIDDCSELGTGMQIIQGKRIGADSIVGAGAVVVRDIPSNCTAVGCPAQPIKFR